MAGPMVALGLGGPWAGAVGSVVAILAWTFLGRRPLSGLVPGLLSLAVWFQCAGVLLYCAVRLVRAMSA